MKKKTQNNQSPVEVVMSWKYNPSAIENRVEEKPFSNHELQLLKNCKF